ncbi:NADP-specific glutamate dehydrogenase [Pseudoxanthomonas jiangsuensis]|uniref:NADP-specific glutamate dehydrogenase n=1 Tax=Pseudoxanthomonas jiangsuensis TaxID=619688 RepID=UPI0013917DCE|nr:NADP-specific glutamate dehydrogenase [Pseudoxanthomonas jiangsuensis]KAF1691055.1 NADP-specific glutamate dehydrogenase [Pseudoxanthomonas jiangsuensis]
MPGSREDFLARVERRDPGQPEFLQAVKEVAASLWPFLERHPEYARMGLLERLVEPERAIQFRVSWVDDRGQVQVNRAFRVQHSSAIGPYKGGMRFHPSVNLSILKFLAFEQTFKNALTTLPMGGGKGGSDFDPKGKSEGEVMRFCQALMLELYRHLGPDTDVPAGDIGVGAREVGYMAGMMKKLSNQAGCVFTGKGISYGGSLMRPEATGYGTVYFVEQMLHHARRQTHGARVLVSGSGNVAQFAAIKATELGGKVLTFSDSDGTLYARDGFDAKAIAQIAELKNERRGRLAELGEDARFEYLPGKRPWHVPAEIALPCATQNELDGEDARTLVKNGVVCVAEGANMPSTLEAVDVFLEAGTLYAPGKASNAGGVATSGLEMSQNALRLSWHHAEVDERLHVIMKDIHANCVRHGKRRDGSVNYVDGANIAGFVKVADAMLAQGVN